MARPPRPGRAPGAWIAALPVLGLLGLLELRPGARPDPRLLLEAARPLSAAAVDPAAESEVVAVTGPLLAAAPLSDPGLLRPGEYVEIWRDVEMFAWHEEEVGPGLYRYEPRWSPDPPATQELHQPEGHENPPMPLRSDVLSAPRASVGVYRFRADRAVLLPAPLALTEELLAEDDRRRRIVAGGLYIGEGSEEAPRLGDVRIRYQVVRAGQVVTLFGEQRRDEVLPAYGADGARLYHLLPGTRSEAIGRWPELLARRPALLR